MTDLEIQEKNRKWLGCHGCNVMCSACRVYSTDTQPPVPQFLKNLLSESTTALIKGATWELMTVCSGPTGLCLTHLAGHHTFRTENRDYMIL